MYRFKKGSGFPVSVPSVDLVEIGAGGGSLARIDELGLLKVGPESAGADPGPGVLRPRRHRARGHRCRPRARPARRRVLPRRRHAARPRRQRRARCSPSPTGSACRPATPPRASTSWSTRTWPRRRACMPSSRARTCVASRCWRSAAPGRSTPAASPSCSSRRGSIFPVNASVLVGVRHAGDAGAHRPRPLDGAPARRDRRTTSAMRCSTSCAKRVAACWPRPACPPTGSGSATGSTPATSARATSSRSGSATAIEWPATDGEIVERFETRLPAHLRPDDPRRQRRGRHVAAVGVRQRRHGRADRRGRRRPRQAEHHPHGSLRPHGRAARHAGLPSHGSRPSASDSSARRSSRSAKRRP